MLEAALPFGTLLLGTGVGKLIGKLFKNRGGNGTERSELPRVVVTGPKTEVLICQICMGRIKEGTEFCSCGTGRVFHSVCLERLGSCPYCKRTYAIKGRESTTSREVTDPIASSPGSEEPSPPAEEGDHCPVCGGSIEEDAETCPACGAIFVADGGTFACPACGSRVGESEGTCPNCGEPFRPFTPRTCPACGIRVGPNDKKCICGAILGDTCPECGAQLSEEDIECPNCGAIFEFVERQVGLEQPTSEQTEVRR